MTNREWLASLSNEDLAKVFREGLFEDCSVCPHDLCGDCLGDDDCMDAILPWLEAEHEEDSDD